MSLLFAGSSAIVLSNPIKLEKIDATQTTNYLTGYSGEVLYVNGQSKWFNDGEANLAVYFYKSDNTSINAWANPEYVYRLFADAFIVPVPYFNGEKVKYYHLIICRYDVSKNLLVNGFDGRLNQTNDISIANATIYGKNAISITGINDGILQYGTYVTNQNGIKSESHIYLDLSGFTDWETGGAKFAVYFGYPNFRAEETVWSKAYSDDHSAFTSAFCWKVKGQNNEHLYECIVPNINGKGGNNHVWSMVIAVRLNPDCSEPNWDCKWNQTQNLGINSTNTNANIIKITDWDKGELLENYITDDDRADFLEITS